MNEISRDIKRRIEQCGLAQSMQKIEQHGLRRAMCMMTTMECWSLCVAICNENTVKKAVAGGDVK